MALIDIFRRAAKSYITKVRCNNCSSVSELKVPKGRTIDEFISSSEAICPNCHCATLKRIIIVGRVATPPKEMSNAERIKRAVVKVDRAMTPRMPRRARPLPQEQSEPEYEVQYQDVRHPVRRNERVANKPEPETQDYIEPDFQPDFSARPKKINMWTGKEQKD